MAAPIKLTIPNLGDFKDVEVIEVLVEPGDAVAIEESLITLETDKATMEFESFQEGFLLHIGVKENETAQVDSVLAILGKKGENISSLLNVNNGKHKEEIKSISEPEKVKENAKQRDKNITLDLNINSESKSASENACANFDNK